MVHRDSCAEPPQLLHVQKPFRDLFLLLAFFFFSLKASFSYYRKLSVYKKHVICNINLQQILIAWTKLELPPKLNRFLNTIRLFFQIYEIAWKYSQYILNADSARIDSFFSTVFYSLIFTKSESCYLTKWLICYWK